MPLHWSEFPDAPDVGTPVCAINNVQTGVVAISVDGFPILLVSDRAGTRAFVNACPHQFLPLDTRGEVLGTGGQRLICTNHDAAFDARTGEGVAGFGINCALSSVPLSKGSTHYCIASA